MMVEFRFHTLHCVRTGESGAGEPYLWASVVRLDSTLLGQTEDGRFLTGEPQFMFNKGSQRNLGGPIENGKHRTIDPATGRFVFDLQPLNLNLGTFKVETNGAVGYIVALLEENMVPARAMEAAHHAFNAVAKRQMGQLLRQIDLISVGLDVLSRKQHHADVNSTEEEKQASDDEDRALVRQVLLERLGDEIKRIQEEAKEEIVRVAMAEGGIEAVVLQNLFAGLFAVLPAAGFDPDNFRGLKFDALMGDDIAKGEPISDRLRFAPARSGIVGGGGGGGPGGSALYHIDFSFSRTDAIDRWQSLGGELTEAPAVASTGENRIDVFARATNNALYRRRWTGKAWTDWEELGGRIASAPAAVSWGASRLDVFVKGENDRLWQWWSDGQRNGWQELDGELTSGPAVASQERGSLDVFARATDMTLYRKKWRDSSWGEWTPVPGSIKLTSDPAAVAWGKGRLDVFMRGEDMALWQWWTNGQQSGWQRLGGELTSGPAAASRKVNRLDVFARGTDNAIYHILWGGTAWSQWETLGGSAASSPAAVSWGPNRLDLFVRGSDNTLRQRWWDGTWRP